MYRSGWHCLSPLPSSPVPIQPQELFQSWQKRGIVGLCWLQQPEGSITHLSPIRMEKVMCGSLAMLPHHASRKNKESPIPQRLHLHLRHFSAHKPPGRFLQPWTSMSNHFLIPAIPEQGDNKILKPLWRQSILWQRQLPQQSPRTSRQRLAYLSLPTPLGSILVTPSPARMAELTQVDYGD